MKRAKNARLIGPEIVYILLFSVLIYFGKENRKKIITGKASQVFNTSTD